MSDQPELTPEQESHVRRLLAEARHDEPVPAEVGERLDRVLAGLTRDEAGSDGVAPVIDLAARRRRRNAAALLAGAAAVIVAGFAIGQGIGVGGSSDDAGSTAAEPAERDQAGTLTEGKTQESPATPNLAAGGDVAATGLPLRLRSSHLVGDVTSQLDFNVEADSSASRTPAPETFASAYGCVAPAPPTTYGAGELFPAIYDGTPAVLAVRRPAGGTRRADVLACGTAVQLDSATLPLR